MMKRSTLKLALVALFATMAVSIQNAYGQAVSINTSGANPDASSILDVSSTTKGMLIPRMSMAQRNSIGTPATGLVIYQTDNTLGFYYWDGLAWRWLYSGAVPSIPGNVEHWLRPVLAPYIYPEHNTNIKVYDAGQTYGLYYDGGTNQYGLYARTTNVANPTAAVVGFSDVAGNQTYGYLGYDGTYNSGTGFGGLSGMAVYGMVNDPTRAAGFFRTTGNASVAANIGYSDVWIAGYFYIDNASNTFMARPGLYGHSNVSCNQSGRQAAVQGFSEKTQNSNGGYTVGGSFTSIGNSGMAGINDGQDSYGVFGYSSTGNNKTSYGAYCIGEDADYGKGPGSSHSGIGVGAKGSMLGAWAYGDIYGFNASGERYALYLDGKQYTNSDIVQLHESGTDERTVTYVPTSPNAEIILHGIGQLVNGKATINFEEKYQNIIATDYPITITVTPMGTSEGVHIAESKSTYFVVEENKKGNSNVTFSWIAIARKKDFNTNDIARELLSSDYDVQMKRLYNNEHNSDGVTTHKTMYWNGSELIFEDVQKSGLNNGKVILRNTQR